MSDEITRRDFVKTTVVGTAMLTGASSGLSALQSAGSPDPRTRVVAALGATFVPSRPGDPGYADLEPFGISAYIVNQPPVFESNRDDSGLAATAETVDWLSAESLEAFNSSAKEFFGGRSFVDLDEKEREQHLGIIADGTKIADTQRRARLQAVYRNARRRLLRVYYSNYPEHQVKRDAAGWPVLKPGDTHQITNPNTTKVVTGWDIAGYKGQPDWEDEERMRAQAKQDLPYWYEGDLVTLNPSRPPAARAAKTPAGHDYYDVIVLGGGTAGCIVAGRLAERGINPKTGDRLRVAMIEGGDDWTIRDPGIRPGHGYPIRRRMITGISDGIGPDGIGGPKYRWPGADTTSNFKSVGGCSLHFGGTCWIPDDEDFHFYRQSSGVDWDQAKFGDAIQEIRDYYHVMNPPDSWWTKGDHVWADGARALGFEVRVPEIAFRNPIGFDGGLSKCDTKGTALPFAYIGMNNGLKIIANAEVEKILIEKSAGGRAVAVGAVYKDQAGRMHEVRAARVISAMGMVHTPLLFFRSGYGPREYLGDKLIVENKNVGNNISGDCNHVTYAYLSEPVAPDSREGAPPGADAWVSFSPRPWRDLTWQSRGGSAGAGGPAGQALNIFAPGYGWEHKEFMRNGFGSRHVLVWRNHLGAIPAVWRMPPDGKIQLVHMDEARVGAAQREGAEIVRSWYGKLPVKPIKQDMRAFSVKPANVVPVHRVGTARAGDSRENSVCTSDFDCHDIDHLIITSAAAVPKTFFWTCGPVSVNAAYAWRRIVSNHFSRGCSTEGFA